MPFEGSPMQNRLLTALNAWDLERLRPYMSLEPLPLGHVLYESGGKMRDVHFPVSGVVSLLYTLYDGRTVELAVVGNEGCVGIAILLGGATMPHRAVVQIGGYAYRVNAEALMAQFHESGPAQLVLLRYIQALMTQMSQTAVCNRHHSVEQQLSRWLLLSLDRVAASEIRMTQDLISSMLGVRRAGITQAARKLQAAGLIVQRRGVIKVPDRARLEAQACECYRVIRNETERLLSPPSPAGPAGLRLAR